MNTQYAECKMCYDTGYLDSSKYCCCSWGMLTKSKDELIAQTLSTNLDIEQSNDADCYHRELFNEYNNMHFFQYLPLDHSELRLSRYEFPEECYMK